MEFLLDSNVIIAYFKIDDTNHKKATDIIESLNEFVITEHVLFEIGTVLLMKAGQEITQKANIFLTKNANIRITKLSDLEFQKITEHFPYQNTQISYVDLSLLTIAKNRNLELISFDEELMSAYKKLNHHC